jgi:cytoskeletal protein RodZ
MSKKKVTGKKWYQKTGWAIFFIFFFWPVGLFLTFKYTNWKKTLGISLAIFILLVILGGIAGKSGNNNSNTATVNATTQEATVPVESSTIVTTQETATPTESTAEVTTQETTVPVESSTVATTQETTVATTEAQSTVVTEAETKAVKSGSYTLSNGATLLFSSSVRNDVTGRWRISKTSDSMKIQDYAVEYYNTLFSSDDEIHAIVNFSTSTTTRISKVSSDTLDVCILEYVDGEEHDAKELFSGSLLKEYWVNIKSGEIEDLD